MRAKSFKDGIEGLIRDVQEEGKRFAVTLGFKIESGLSEAVRDEITWGTSGPGGYDETERIDSLILEKKLTPQVARLHCLCALEVVLNPFGDLNSADLDWCTGLVDKCLTVLRKWARGAAPPPDARKVREWNYVYEQETAARRRILELEEEIRALNREASRARAACVG